MNADFWMGCLFGVVSGFTGAVFLLRYAVMRPIQGFVQAHEEGWKTRQAQGNGTSVPPKKHRTMWGG